MTTPRSFANVTYDEAMARARALVPVLRERADGAEAGREMQKETLEDLHRAGLLRFHQPRRWGGMEIPFVALFDVPAEIGWGAVDKPDPQNPVGVKGVGEPVQGSGAAAITSAISDAVGGHLFNRTPVSLDMILNHLNKRPQAHKPLQINTV